MKCSRALLLLLAPLLLALGGCLHTVEVSPQADSAAVQNSEMGYVLCAYKGNMGVTFTNTVWNGEIYGFLDLKPIHHKPNVEYVYRFVTLNPGTYTLTTLHLADSAPGGSRWINQPAFTQAWERDIPGISGTFTVEKGKVNYLGDLSCYAVSAPPANPDPKVTYLRMRMLTTDNRAAALDYVRKNYPGINAQKLLIYNSVKFSGYFVDTE